MKTKISILAFITLFQVNMLSFAQGCCSSGAPLLGSMELGTTTAGLWQIGISYRFNTLNDIYLGSRSQNDNFRQRKTKSMAAEINYGLGKNFTLNLLLTFVQQERKIQPGYVGGMEDFVSIRGLSDIILMLKYSLLAPNLISQRELSFGLGTKFPTGSENETRNNILVSYDLQPGTGATDGILWGYFFQGFLPKRYLLSGVASYRFTGTNDLNYRFGNEFVGSLGVNYRISNHLNLTGQLRYRSTTPDKFLKLGIPNTGGEWLYYVPGINIPLGKSLTLRTAIEIPVYRNLRGIQLTTTYALSFSAFYSF